MTNETIKAANGSMIRLTRMGEMAIYTNKGTIKLSKVYIGKDLEYNLLSVPEFNKRGVNVML